GALATGDTRWDDRFSHPHPGIDGAVYALAVDASGGLYAGGLFATAGGTPAKNVARWSKGMWSALSLGLDDQVNALAVDASGKLYAGGEFTMAGGASARHVAGWNGASWSALGTGVGVADSESVSAVTVDGGGNLYACGNFVVAGGVSADHAALWNGTSWSALGSREVTHALSWSTGGSLYAGGDVLDQWSGTSWLP